MRAEYYLRLVGGAAVIVPDGQLLHVLGLLVESLCLAPESLPGPVNPDVESLHPAQNTVSGHQRNLSQIIIAKYCQS